MLAETQRTSLFQVLYFKIYSFVPHLPPNNSENGKTPLKIAACCSGISHIWKKNIFQWKQYVHCLFFPAFYRYTGIYQYSSGLGQHPRSRQWTLPWNEWERGTVRLGKFPLALGSHDPYILWEKYLLTPRSRRCTRCCTSTVSALNILQPNLKQDPVGGITNMGEGKGDKVRNE